MTDPSDAPQYEKHDFSAVNAYVDGVSHAVFERARSARAERFATYAKYTALVVVALGVLALLFLWGLSFLQEPRVVTETKIVEKPIAFRPNIYIDSSSPIERTRNVAQRRVKEVASEAGEAIDIFNFVIFREISFGESGFGDVIVGMSYANGEATSPTNQWCYVERDTSGVAALREKITLANKNRDKVVETPVLAQHARKLGTTVQTLVRAQNKCEFR